MCDKSAFRSGREEPIPKPRTAEELLELAQKKKKPGMYANMQEDYFR